MSDDIKSKNNSWYSWFLWWKMDPNTLEKQIQQYKSLKIYESYRGIATLLIVGWVVLTDLFAVINWIPRNKFIVSLFIYERVELFSMLLYFFLAFFIYKGKKWAMIIAMFLITIDRGFALFHSVSLGVVDTIFWIMIIFWWCVFMKYFYGAYRVEKARNKNSSSTNSEK